MRKGLIFTVLLQQLLFPFNLTGQSMENTIDINFKKHMIHSDFISEGVAVGDVNKDGSIDILAGAYWFEAPTWVAHEIRSPVNFDYTKEWSDSFLNFVLDVNSDGWLDFISFDFPGTGVYWFENPKGEDMHWNRFIIDTVANNESPMMADVDNDGRMDLVFGTGNNEMIWYKAPVNGSTKWVKNSISLEQAPGTSRFSHGLGFGDINSDGKKNILITDGWWSTPDDVTEVPWMFHEVNLGQPSSQMHVFDFDNDGNNDVITASAHNYGIWWHQQIKNTDGVTTFKEHLINKSFSQTHGVALEDLNMDGLPDLITGKRYFGHNGKDPGGFEPAVIYWLELQRGADGQPDWKPHLIDDDSGVGLQVVIHDMNKDNKKDIIISNKKGVFLFEGY